MAQKATIDSNVSGTRICEALASGLLDVPANQRWLEMEPNSFNDFGGEITTTPRTPINPSRQRKPGLPTDQNAGGTITSDVTQANMQELLQGFFYADYRRKGEFNVTGTPVAITVASADNSYAATGIHSPFRAGDLVLVSGAGVAANNGLKNVATAASNKITVTQTLVNEAANASIKVVAVGFQFASGDATITVSGGYPVLGATAKDLTQLGLTPGEWFYLGGDSAATRFNTAAVRGWCRVRSVTATAIVIDKTDAAFVTDNGSGKTIQIFVPRALKNETGTAIKRRRYWIERTLGAPDDAQPTREQAEYIEAAVPNRLSITAETANKLVAELQYVGNTTSVIDEVVAGANTLLSKVSGAVRVPVVEADAFNTSSDFSRIRIAVHTEGTSAPTPLFTYNERLELVIDNGNQPSKALGVFGAFDYAAGDFSVEGNITAYFGNVAAINTVKNGARVTFDFALAKSNAGLVFDLPLVVLGSARANVEKDTAIKMPLTMPAATAKSIAAALDHTLMLCVFDYLPSIAEA